MPAQAPVTATFGPDAPAAPITAKLILAMAASGELDVDAVDELVMAVELALDAPPRGERVVALQRTEGGGLEVTLRPVSAPALERRRPLLEALVSHVRVAEEGVVLRAGG